MRRRSALENVDQAIREAKVFENLYEETRQRSHRKWVGTFARTMKSREDVYAAAPPADHPRHEIMFEERQYPTPNSEHRSRASTANSGYKESYRLMRSHRARELVTSPGEKWMMNPSAGAFKKASQKGFETLTLPPIHPLHPYPENAGYPCGLGWVPING
jgi:hypothetical protein